MASRPATRSASIPSKALVRTDSGQNLLHRSLVVKKLNKGDGVVKSCHPKLNQTTNGPARADQYMTGQLDIATLRKSIHDTLQTVNYDQRSFDLLLRLLKTTPQPCEVTDTDEVKRENERPSTPTPSLDDEDGGRVVDVESTVEFDDRFVFQVPRNGSPERIVDKITCEQLNKSAQSVNAIIARERTLQRQNLRSRRRNRKQPAVASSSSNESLTEEEAKTRKDIFSMSMPREVNGNWLALSGSKIKLRHQNHVTRVLNGRQSEIGISNSTFSVNIPNEVKSRPERNIKSAPLSQSANCGITGVKGRKWAWSGGTENRFVSQRLRKSLEKRKEKLDFSTSLHSGAIQVETQKISPTGDKLIPEENGIVLKSSFRRKSNDYSATNEPKVQQQQSTEKIGQTQSAYSVISNPNEAAGVKSIIIHLPNSTSKQNKVTFQQPVNGNVEHSDRIDDKDCIEKPKLSTLKLLAGNHSNNYDIS